MSDPFKRNSIHSYARPEQPNRHRIGGNMWDMMLPLARSPQMHFLMHAMQCATILHFFRSWAQHSNPGLGGGMTTHALGEEGASTNPALPGGGGMTTRALGEEGASTNPTSSEGGGMTTQAMGEEGASTSPTSSEGGGMTTQAMGEEGASTGSLWEGYSASDTAFPLTYLK